MNFETLKQTRQQVECFINGFDEYKFYDIITFKNITITLNP